MNTSGSDGDSHFRRTRLLLGDESCEILERSHVTVIGLGAVGGWVAEHIVRCGVGALRLVDFDMIRESNFNRQILALHSTLGRPKTHAARNRFLDINPRLGLEVFDLFCHEETFDIIFAQSTDLVIDAIDSFTPKVRLLEMAVKRGIPIISSMGAALRRDPLAIRVADISETRICPLAFRIRKELRKRGIVSGVRCVFSEERPAAVAELEQPFFPEPEHILRGRKRAVIGSISYMTGIFGCVIAAEAINHLTGARLRNEKI